MSVILDRAETAVVLRERARPSTKTLAWTPVLLIATAVAAVLLLTSGRYGYFADELYFLAAGEELSWGYADQPPLVPLIAATLDALFPGSLVALRTPSALVAAAGVVVVAMLAREFDGDRRAQLWAAGAWAVAGQTIGAGHILATASFDVFLWTVITLLLVRWVRLRDDRLLLGAGLVTAVALQVKILIPMFWVVLGIAVLLTGPRELLRRPMLWLGAAITTATAVPTLHWQATHGWPQLAMGDTIAGESPFGWSFLPIVVVSAGLVGGVLVCLGIWRLLRAPHLRPYRFLAWTALGVTCVVMAVNGRPYYVAGFYGLLLAVGAVELCRRRQPGRRSTTLAFTASAMAAACALPLLPVSAIQSFDVVSSTSIGWWRITSAITDTARRYPSDVIITDDYWSASAVRQHRQDVGGPEVYSPSRGFWYLGTPPESARRAIYFGGDQARLLQHFGSVRLLGTVDTDLPVDTRYEGKPIYLVQDPYRPWEQLWPRLKRFDLPPDLS